MKKIKIITLSIITVCLSFTSYAQIQLSADDVMSKGVYKFAEDTNSVINIGTPGASKTWDFSNLKKHLSTTTIIAPYIDNGKGIDANLVEITDGDTDVYYKKTSSGIIYVMPDKEFGKTDLNFMNFPFGYLSKTVDSSQIFYTFSGAELNLPLLDSVRLFNLFKITTQCDAWGTIKIPSGTFNSLRVKNIIEIKMWAQGKVGSGKYFSIPGFDEKDSFSQFSWYTNGKGNLIASCDTETPGMTYYESGILSAEKIEKTIKNDIIVANPIKETFYIKNISNQTYNISLRDISGKQIICTELKGGEEYNDNAEFLPCGTYIMNVNQMQSGKSFNSILIK